MTKMLRAASVLLAALIAATTVSSAANALRQRLAHAAVVEGQEAPLRAAERDRTDASPASTPRRADLTVPWKGCRTLFCRA